jgi:hypothetical protein
MPTETMPDENAERLAAQANELYWHTSRPAGRLADELGISRSKFYALIRPLQLDVTCGTCGAPLAVGSRSDREAGRARCTGCGATAHVADEQLRTHAPSGPLPRTETADADAPARPSTDLPAIDLPGGREIWLSALAGLAAGLLVAALWRRR